MDAWTIYALIAMFGLVLLVLACGGPKEPRR